MTSRTRTRAEHAIADLTEIINLHDATTQALDDSLAGYPTQTGTTAHNTGCRCGNPQPCPDHPDTPNTTTETGALNPDRARRDLHRYRTHIAQLAHHANTAAAIARYWGIPGTNKDTIQERLDQAKAIIWCNNCLTHGHNNVRREGAKHCDWCLDFQRQWHRLPAKPILDLKAAKGRIYQQDIVRIHARLDEGKKRKR